MPGGCASTWHTVVHHSQIWAVSSRICHLSVVAAKDIWHQGRQGDQSDTALRVDRIVGFSIQVRVCRDVRPDGRETYFKDNHGLVDSCRRNLSAGGWEDWYVWVLSSLEEVVYVYSDTREGDMIQSMLAEFRGVLV